MSYSGDAAEQVVRMSLEGAEVAAKITMAQVKEIAEAKMPDLNCSTVEAAMNMVKGQAVSMGIQVTE